MPEPVLTTEFVRYLASLGVGGVIAGFMFTLYRKDMREYAELWRGQSAALLKALTDSTAAITRNTDVIVALSRAMDRERP